MNNGFLHRTGLQIGFPIVSFGLRPSFSEIGSSTAETTIVLRATASCDDVLEATCSDTVVLNATCRVNKP